LLDFRTLEDLTSWLRKHTEKRSRTGDTRQR
jgi:hypothetical protein